MQPTSLRIAHVMPGVSRDLLALLSCALLCWEVVAAAPPLHGVPEPLDMAVLRCSELCRRGGGEPLHGAGRRDGQGRVRLGRRLPLRRHQQQQQRLALLHRQQLAHLAPLQRALADWGTTCSAPRLAFITLCCSSRQPVKPLFAPSWHCKCRSTCRCMSGRRRAELRLPPCVSVAETAAAVWLAARCMKLSLAGAHADASSGSCDGRCFDRLGDLRQHCGFASCSCMHQSSTHSPALCPVPADIISN